MAKLRSAPEPVDSYYEEPQIETKKAPGMFDLAYLLPRLIARWHWVLIGILLGVLLGVITIRMTVPEYRSTATVRVKSQISGQIGELPDPNDFNLHSQEVVEEIRSDFKRTELFLAIASDPTVRNLANLVPPEAPGIMGIFQAGQKADKEVFADTPEPERLSGMINGWTSTEARRGTRLIDISVNHTDPDVAQVIANQVVFHYIKLRKEAKEGDNQSDLKYLVNETERLQKELAASRRRAGSYSPALEAEKEMVIAEKAIQDLGIRYGHLHPKMISATDVINLKNKILLSAMRDALSDNLEKDYWGGFEAEIDDIENEENFKELRQAMVLRASLLTNEVEALNSLYNTLLARVEVLKTNAEGAQAEVIPTEDSVRPWAPFSPNRKKIMVKTTLLGLCGGLALAFMFQFVANKIHGVADVEQTFGISILSAVQKLPPEDELLEEMENLRDLPVSMKHISPTLAVPGWKTDFVHSEMFRVLRASISLLGDANQRKITLITSSITGEGKTFCAANLALAYAKQGTRTLLIDFDLRKPSVHKIFNEERAARPGIVNVLNGTAAANQAITVYPGLETLSVIYSGPKSPNPGELLEPGRLRALIGMFSANFDHIVIDSAPLLPVPDTRILAPLVDNLALVVRADHTPVKNVQGALEILNDDGVNPSGIILNGFTENRLQGGKYGYGYGYGHYGDDA
ncbi:polysaccharide biosynthesis tyrosine autokinase [Akkermansiaceae bacterium]|nr:polysaccharide biosynthesis tyrosine autokinase [Akkermansiaceae bacterium]